MGFSKWAGELTKKTFSDKNSKITNRKGVPYEKKGVLGGLAGA
jgi:hypothetical protein